MEDEISKHTKKVLKTLNHTEKGWLEKIKEVLFEILIIVFGVTISIWFHERSEHKKESKEARAFVLGIKEDLLKNIKSFENIEKELIESKKRIEAMNALAKLPNDSLLKHSNSIEFRIYFHHFENGRYEGFKSSGKISTIENEEVRNKILGYFQQLIPALTNLDNYYNTYQIKLQDLILEANSREEIIALLKSRKVSNLLSVANSASSDLLSVYKDAIKTSKELVSAIEKDENYLN